MKTRGAEDGISPPRPNDGGGGNLKGPSGLKNVALEVGWIGETGWEMRKKVGKGGGKNEGIFNSSRKMGGLRFPSLHTRAGRGEKNEGQGEDGWWNGGGVEMKELLQNST